jgi:hypothetical protein
MKTQRFLAVILQLVFAFVAMALADEAMAQRTRGCLKDGQEGKEADCIEFKVRYYAADKRLELVDPSNNQVLSTTCKLGEKPCPDMGGQLDLKGVEIMQFQKNSHCYRLCSGGSCYDRCPGH